MGGRCRNNPILSCSSLQSVLFEDKFPENGHVRDFDVDICSWLQNDVVGAIGVYLQGRGWGDLIVQAVSIVACDLSAPEGRHRWLRSR